MEQACSALSTLKLISKELLDCWKAFQQTTYHRLFPIDENETWVANQVSGYQPNLGGSC